MSRTAETRKTIKGILSDYCDKVYYQNADDEKGFPYVIFTLEDVATVDGAYNCELELNCCDYGRSTAFLEGICDNIIKALDHHFESNDFVAFTSYFARKNNVASDDPNVIRRRMVFDLTLYEKE